MHLEKMILPWQQSFLESSPDLNHCNQSRLLVTKRDFNDSLLEEILINIIHRHEALRCGFNLGLNGWNLSVLPSDQVKSPNLISRYDLDDFEEADQSECITFCCNQAQESLNIFQAELIKVVYFKNVQEGRLFIVIHELAIDRFSWETFLKEFEYVYNQLQQNLPIHFDAKTTAFPNFFNQLKNYANSDQLIQQKKYWINTLKDSWVGSIPVDHPDFSLNTINETKKHEITWTKENSSLLLKKCNQVYHTETIVLLLAALAKTIEKTTDESSLRVSLQKRVEESMLEKIQGLNNCIGDLTYTFPLTISLPHRSSYETVIKSIKQQLRAVPQKGLGFEMLRYVKKDEDLIPLTSNSESWIRFNFQEQSDSTLTADSNCFSGNASEEKGNEYSPTILRKHVLSFDGCIINDQIQFTIDYNELQYQAKTIESLANTFTQIVEEIVSHCMHPYAGGYIPSDFPLATLSDFEIDELSFKYPAIEDIYPASIHQKTLLHYNSSRLNTNVNQVIFRIQGKADFDKLKNIGATLINQHSILRSVFYGDFNNLHQVILPAVTNDWTYLTWDEQNSSTEEQLSEYCQSLRNETMNIDGPLINFHVVQFSDRYYTMIWNIHQALLDKKSITLFGKILASNLNLETEIHFDNKIFSDQKPHLSFSKQILEASNEFWDQQLNRLTDTTLFEDVRHDLETHQLGSHEITISKDLQYDLINLCQKTGTSLESVILSSYALSLQAYRKQKKICIGMISSSPFCRLQESEMVGVFENIIPSIIDMETVNLSVSNFLQKTHQDILEQENYIYRPYLDQNNNSPFETILYIDDFSNSAIPTFSGIHYTYDRGYPLNLVSKIHKEISFVFNFQLHVFDRKSIIELASHLVSILQTLCLSPNDTVHSLFIYKNTSLRLKNKEIILPQTGDRPRPTDEERSVRQIKIKGFKVDFNRIENQINAFEKVTDSLVILHKNKLIAFVVCSDVKDKSESLALSLSKTLPGYMIPELFFWIDSLSVLDTPFEEEQSQLFKTAPPIPVKVDRPKNSTEETILQIWKNVLCNESITIEDRFAQLGGDSLKAIKVFSKIKALGLPITIMDIFESQTIADIANRILTNRKTIKLPKNASVKGLGKFLPFHINYFNNYKVTAWNISRQYSWGDRINEKLMLDALNILYAYHDALRINFIIPPESSSIRDIKMFNLGVQDMQPNFMVYDWSFLSHEIFTHNIEHDIKETEEKNTPTNSNLSAFRIYKGPNEDIFYMMSSHLICDGISFELLQKDIFEWYNVLCKNQPISLKQKTDSYILATKETFRYANSSQILTELTFWENIYSSFNNNKLIPRDHNLTEKKHLKQNIAYKKTLLQDKNLYTIEKACISNQTTMIDLILASFGKTIYEWCKIDSLGIIFFTSGREYPYSDIDVSNTFGCFTAAKSIHLDSSKLELDLLEKSASLTHWRDSLPNKGTASDLLLLLQYYKGLDHNSDLAKRLNALFEIDTPLIMFNYFDHRTSPTNKYNPGLKEASTVKMENDSGVGDSNSNFFKFDLYHNDNSIILYWTYNELEYDKKTIAYLSDKIEQALLSTMLS